MFYSGGKTPFSSSTRTFLSGGRKQCLPNGNIQNILLNLPRTPAYSLVTGGSRAGWRSCLCAWPPPTSSACSPPHLHRHLQLHLPGGGRALGTLCLNCLKKYIKIHYSIAACTVCTAPSHCSLCPPSYTAN